MVITVELLEEKFEEYNKLYFGGRLLWPHEFYLIRSFRCFGPILLGTSMLILK